MYPISCKLDPNIHADVSHRFGGPKQGMCFQRKIMYSISLVFICEMSGLNRVPDLGLKVFAPKRAENKMANTDTDQLLP